MKNKITIALSGNPNSGKTTVFNAITGARQQIANYPGVTVEKKVGHVTHKGRKNTCRGEPDGGLVRTFDK